MPPRPSVLVIGAGPGGLAAAERLIERASGRIAVLVVTRGGRAQHLPGTLDVLLGDRTAEDLRAPVSPPGVEVRAGDVQAVDGGGAVVDGRRVEADAVIAAPGLELELEALPAWPRSVAAWDLDSAAAARPALAAARGGRMVVAVCSVPYRCPPAPFSLALELAFRHLRSGRFAKLCVTTPEPFPLAGVGGDAPAFLLEACRGAGVEVEREFAPDLAASEGGVLRARDGRERRYRSLILVPPHRRPAALRSVPGPGPLVEVDERGATPVDGLFAVGDCAATGLPRAAGVAEATGRTAADAVLARLGVCDAAPAHPIEATCYLRHGGGSVSRISVRYPEGPPPRGAARVDIAGPSLELAHAAEGERRRFLRLAGAG